MAQQYGGYIKVTKENDSDIYHIDDAWYRVQLTPNSSVEDNYPSVGLLVIEGKKQSYLSIWVAQIKTILLRHGVFPF